MLIGSACPQDGRAGGAMNRCWIAVVTLLALVAFDVNAVERQAVTAVKPLLFTAIDQGEAHGLLVGPPARSIAQAFQSTAPIEITVKTIRALRAPGCKRLAVTTSQDGVLDFNHERRETQASRKAFTYEFDYCRDGRIPPSAEATP